MTVLEAKEIVEEIRSLKRENGLVYCEDIVRWAQVNPDSKLHSRFEWDDDKAAWNYRMWQAREIIGSIMMTAPETAKEIRVFCALSTDSSGYRETVAVISQQTTREIYLSDILAELNRLKDKYESVQELSGVWVAIDEATVAASTNGGQKKKARRKKDAEPQPTA